MNKNPKLIMIAGLVVLIIGVALMFLGGPPKASAAQQAQCVARLSGEAALAARCKEAAFATAMTATDADAAARSISAANNAEIGGGMLSKFLIGLGLVLAIGGFLIGRRQKA